MRKLLFALALMVMGAFAFGAGSPASAMPASPVTGMSEIVKPDGAAQNVHYRRRWRHRHHYYRPYYYRPYRYYYYRPYYRPYRRHYRRCYW